MKYAPANLEIEQGAVVKWTNHDAVPHNVFVQEPFEVVGDMLRAGQSVALKFTTPGEYSYICTPHPFMKGKITVKAKS
jgi:amicyanin